ncbi:kinase-like protein [Suillus brevipes Sb2]|nr:kinase-like protein [Suillus brevipes Sb2]
MNGMSTATSSTITTAARENVHFSPADGLPGRPGNSTIKWGGALRPHLEVGECDHDLGLTLPGPSPRPIIPSLATLEKAVSARIYFENLYFPLLRQPPSREQRRIAMEKDMVIMHLSEDQKEALRAQWRQNETEYLRERRRKVDATAFIKLKTIGHGAFGVVYLVKERVTGQLFAMKQLRKSDMLRKGQEGHVRAERDILKSASLVASPGGAEWIVKLYYSFQDRDNLYLVLEFMGGGDLLNLLIERDVFEEDFARFYVAEMVLAIETCHKHGFIHRDIKPDNFLFDPQGHIRLSDFGLATDLHWAHDTSYYEQQRHQLLHKHGIDLEDGNGIGNGTRTKRMDRKDVELLMGDGNGQSGIFTWREKNRRKLAYSVCGTNSYMSPEVIRGHGYSFSCDWWSLGIIMFECLYGYPPFVSNSRHVTRQKILNWKQSLKFPSRPRVSGEGVNLMQRLLCEPEDRLGSQAPAAVSRPDSLAVHARRSGFILPGSTVGSVDGVDAIKAHPWFRGIDWENIHRYPAPYRPDLQSPEDTQHFDSDIPPVPLAPANGAPADATKDPLLRDRVHGEEILNVRKALAFAGFTHKSPRAISYARADRAFDAQADIPDQERGERGRPRFRSVHEAGTGRAISL